MQIVGVCVLICLANLPKTICDETHQSTNHKFTQEMNIISDTWIGRLGVIVNFTIFWTFFSRKTYLILISRFPQGLLELLFSNISYSLKWFICVYIVFWLILLEFRNKHIWNQVYFEYSSHDSGSFSPLSVLRYSIVAKRLSEYTGVFKSPSGSLSLLGPLGRSQSSKWSFMVSSRNVQKLQGRCKIFPLYVFPLQCLSNPFSGQFSFQCKNAEEICIFLGMAVWI